MRLVQIVSSIDSEAAGPSYSVPRLSRSLVDAGHDCTLLSLGESGWAETMGVRHKRCSRSFARIPILRTLGLSPEMKRTLIQLASAADILHTHGLWRMPNIYPALAGGSGRSKVVLSPRGMLSRSALQYSAIAKRLFLILGQGRALNRVALFHATSEEEFEDIRRAGLRQPVAVIPNGVDVPEQPPPRSAGVGTLRTLLYLGRLHPIKRVDLLIQSWAELEKDFPNWRLAVHGPGDAAYRADLCRLSNTLRLSRCEIGGAIFGSEKFRVFSDASLFVLPSASENFAMTVAESLACGTPVITTRGAPWAGLRDHECGWWINHGRQALCVALREAMSCTDTKLLRMGMAGRKWMQDEFSWEAIGGEMTKAYYWHRFGGDIPPSIRI